MDELVQKTETMSINTTDEKLQTETVDENFERMVTKAVEKARKEWMKEIEKAREEWAKELAAANERVAKLERELLAEQSKNRVLRYEWLLQNRCALAHLRYIGAHN